MDQSGTKWKDIVIITAASFVAKYKKKAENLIKSLIKVI